MQQSWEANDLTGDATFVEVSGNNPDVYRWYLDEFYQKLFYSDRLETTQPDLQMFMDAPLKRRQCTQIRNEQIDAMTI